MADATLQEAALWASASRVSPPDRCILTDNVLIVVFKDVPLEVEYIHPKARGG